ncbi:MAG: HDOD domain-containing protein, partial [Limisphaerales bacterium]
IELCNVAFTSGLLHDIGKLILAANAEAEYRSAMEIAEKEGTPLHYAEQQTFGCTHAQLGAYLFTLWGFPDGVVRAVENHHKLEGIEAFTPALAIHVAQGLQRGAEHEKLLNMELLQALNLTEKIPVWQEAIANTET